MHVLLLGGYPPLLKALRRGLEDEGHAVDVGPVPDAGPPATSAGEYDVILLDVSGPPELGRSLLRRWRRGGLTTPVLVLTAPEGAPARGFHAAADDWLAKPFDLDELLPRLSALACRAREVDDPDLCHPHHGS
jgi:two-component system OmpR family response regulator